MSYINDSLSNGETVYQIFTHHWVVRLLVILNFAIAFATLGLWLIPAITYWLKWRCVEQGVTNKRVIHKHGIISRKTDELKLSAVESIYITQGIIGRILGFGTVTVTGRGQGDVKLSWMDNPMGVKRELENVQGANDIR
jgi:uncharacterized membrane protein YdbT with pleckstrin-like domain